jgi:acyl-CoA thioesterase YciA
MTDLTTTGLPSPAGAQPEWPSDEPVIRVIAMPHDTNPEGDIFGGWLMSQMDLASATVAFRLAQGRCVTVAIDRVRFISPVFVGDEVSIFAEAWRRRRDGPAANKVTEGAFTFVAIDENRKPRALPV